MWMTLDTQVLENSVTKNDGNPVLFQMVVADPSSCTTQMPDLPHGWSHERDYILRSTMHWDKFWASSVRRAISQAAAAAWEIRGQNADKVRQAHELFLAANTVGYDRRKVAWGRGWSSYMNQHLRAYLLTGNGAFTEVVYKGSRVVGFIHLDPYRCFKTGDDAYPVEYTDSQGYRHELPYHRVFNLTDFNTESQFENECGTCAAECAYDEIRIHAVIQQKYWERISGRNADTLDLIGGITQTQLDGIVAGADSAADAKGYLHYMGHILAAVPGEVDLTHVAIQLAGVEPDYDRRQDYEIARNRYALALDVDPQDLAPLDSNAYGSASQSRVLDRKSRRTTLFGWDADWMELASRYLLDTSTRFHFSEERDLADKRAKAEILSTVSEASKRLTESMILTPDQSLQVGIEAGALPDEFLVREDSSHGPHILHRDDRSTLLHETHPPPGKLPYNVSKPALYGEDGIDFTQDAGNQTAAVSVPDGEIIDDPTGTENQESSVLSRLRNYLMRGRE